MSTLIKGGTLVEFTGPTVERGDLRLEAGKIVARGASLVAAEGETVYDATGQLVCPGFTIAHTHLYSALARGMPGPPVTPDGFPEILEHVWWVLDRALDLELIRYSGLVGAMSAARYGVTSLVDHHASPSAIRGSLAALRGALAEVGVRGRLCYEVTERGTPEQFEAGIAETLEGDYFGVHAAFTLSDAGLARCGAAARKAGLPCHIHVAEDPCDLQGAEPAALLARLERAGLLTPGSIVAHLIHLGDSEVRRLAEAGCWLIHNARSNMNNGVGHARPSRFPGPRRALGTDGIDGNLLAEAKAAWYRACDGADPLGIDGVLALIGGGQRLTGGGTLTVGADADIALLDYDPPTPLEAGNLGGHLVYGLDASQVVGTLVGGEWVYRDGSYPRIDARAVNAEAREAAGRLWSRMAQLR